MSDMMNILIEIKFGRMTKKLKRKKRRSHATMEDYFLRAYKRLLNSQSRPDLIHKTVLAVINSPVDTGLRLA